MFFLFAISSCTKEFVLDIIVNPPEGGSVFPSDGTFKNGTTVTINATPNNEYVFTGWSGDAIGNNTSVQVTVDDNKSVVANFRLVQYELTTSVNGQGSITETIINTGKTDYDSGTKVRLEAVPAQGYYFKEWSGDLQGDTNPADLIINSVKNVTATFEKLSYELRIQTVGEGTVTEEIISTGKSTDYLYGTTVRLTAIPEEGSDFYGWEDEEVLSTDNPFDITISEPKFIKAFFEYELFNEVVGKWKIKKKRQQQQQKSRIYDVKSIVFNQDKTFKLNYSAGQISGTFTVDSNSAITLNGSGSLSNIVVVDNQINFNLNLTSLFQFEVTGTKDEDYQPNRTAISDQNFEQALIDLGYDDLIDGFVNDSELIAINDLDLSDRQITDFSGLEEFINLVTLNLSGNILSDVPLVNLNKLTSLNLSNTGLTQVDLSQNNNITTLDITNNPNLSCVKVSSQIFQQIPSGWIYDNVTNFGLDDCPKLLLISGEKSQVICNGQPIDPIVFEYGGAGVSVNTDTLPLGLKSNIGDGELSISGIPILTDENYTFSVYTSGTSTNFNQASQTISLTKNENSSGISLVSGTFNQTINVLQTIQPIVVTYTGAATGLNIVGPDDEGEISQSGNNYTINASFTAAGTYSGTITTISDGGCPEVVQDIVITVNPAPVTNTGVTDTSNNSANDANTSDTSASSQSGTSSTTNDSSSSAETFSINVSAASFSDYSLSGRDRNGTVSGNDASITIKVGDTINFNLSVAGHPFYIKTSQGTGTNNLANSVSRNGSESGTVSWTPNAVGTYYYQCSLHNGMYGRITVN